MSARLFAAGVMSAAMFAAGPGALAADLYGENYYPPREAAPYDDPRYPDRDRYPPPRRSYEEEGDQYDENYDGRDRAGRYPGPDDGRDRAERYPGPDDGRFEGDRDYRFRGSTRDGYPAPVPPRFTERPYGPDGGCVPRWQIRHRLRAEGWTDFRPLERAGEIATVRARRQDTGREFTLEVDRCSGAIVHARPCYLRTFGAYEPRPWRYRAPY